MTRTLLSTALAGTLFLSLAACQTQNRVPGRAQVAAQGIGDIAYTTQTPAHVYIHNETWNRLEYAGETGPNQTIKINTFRDQISVGGRVVTEKPLGGLDTYRIYIEPMGGAGPGVAAD